ncbi:MAG: tetratricopeptide repeat protein, partial [Gemmatimonadota bacterium]
RLLLGAFLLLLPCLLVAAAEGALRVAGYGGDYPLFVPHTESDAWLVPNVEVGRRYFLDPEDAPRPHMDLLEREKSPKTFRIVVQGASSAAGFPYYFGGSFSRMLRQRLRETFPDRRIEVANVALDATNSYAILDLVDEIVAVDPDAVLLYAGHNEFYGTFGVASAQSVGRVGLVVRSYLVLRRLRIVQLLRDGLARLRASLRRDAPGAGHATLMERLSRDRTVRYGSSLHRAGLEQFRSNLDRILTRYRAAGIPVYVGTVASNEGGLPPFVSRPSDEVDRDAWEAALEEAREALDGGRPAAARKPLEALLTSDSLAPLPHYLLGRALAAEGRWDDAAEGFRRARDYDQLPFRAARAFNDVLRETASRRGATVVETRARLASASPHGIVGGELMLEHVHPRVGGQLLLADAFYEALRADGAIGSWQGWVPFDSARRQAPVTAVDTLAAAYWIARLTAGFPFTSTSPGGAPVTVGDTLHPRDPVEAIALGMYRNALPWPEAQRRLYDYYLSEGRGDDALHVARVLADELPLLGDARLMAGRAAVVADRPEVALEAFRTAQRIRPTLFAAQSIGGLLAARGDTAAARSYFERVVRMAGRDQQAALALRAFDAIPGLERASRERPDDPEVWADLAGTYLLTAQYRRAESAARRALEADPDHPEATEILERVGEVLSPSNGPSRPPAGSPAPGATP